MIRKIIFLTFIVSFLTDYIKANSAQAGNTRMFSGSIEFPHKQEFDLSLFYKGQKLPLETQNNLVQFSFIDHNSVQEIFLIITDGLTAHCKESNNIASLNIAENSTYICYKLNAHRAIEKNDKETLTWTVIEWPLYNNEIPENSLIFLFNPCLITGLRIQSWKPDNVFRIIPTIVINPDSNPEQINRAMTIARLAALDVDALHRKNDVINPTTALLSAWY